MGGWHVWGELRRRPHLDLEWAELDGQRGMIEDLPNGRRRITIDSRLTQRDRRAVLAHELVHDERGILFRPTTPLSLIIKEEAYVVDETARRLVPTDLLLDLVRWRTSDNEAVTNAEVVEAFDVPPHVAERALGMLLQRVNHPALRSSRR